MRDKLRITQDELNEEIEKHNVGLAMTLDRDAGRRAAGGLHPGDGRPRDLEARP